MEKIPTIFERDEHFKVINKFKPECDWVARGEGIVTEKIDGTNIQLVIKDFRIESVNKRRNPSRAEKESGAGPGYVPAHRDDPSDKWIFAAVDEEIKMNVVNMKYLCPDGAGEISCEAYGHKIQGNPLKIGASRLYFFRQFPFVYSDTVKEFSLKQRNYETIEKFLRNLQSIINPDQLAEGVVFHHEDGRMAKIKRKDFKY